MSCVYQGFLSKLGPLKEIAGDAGLGLDEIAYIGDDLQDIPALRAVGFSAAPANAAAEVKKAVHYVCRKKGGDGAVREICELILKSRGKWKDVLRLAEEGRWTKLPEQKIKIVDAE